MSSHSLNNFHIMAKPSFLSHPAIAKWQGRLGAGVTDLNERLLRRPSGEPAPMPEWLTGKWVMLGLGLVVVLVIFGMLQLFTSGNSLNSAAPGTLASGAPSFHSTYPAQVFITKPVARHTVFSVPENTTNTFSPLTKESIERVRNLSPTTPQEVAALKLREVLAQQGYGWSVNGFFEAARKNDLNALGAYIQAGMPVMARNAFSSTALMAAAESNQLEAAKLLLAAGADVNAATTNLQTPLHRAVAAGFPAMTQLLLAAGAQPDAATLEGWTPLFYAVDTNNLGLTDYLVSVGSKPNRQDRFGNTPLMIATRKNAVEMATKLIKLGANMNALDLTGRTALHYAVRGGYYQLTKMLLENGAKATLTDRKGVAPMDIALAQQDLAIANLLLANGAKRTNVLGKNAKPQ